jgi:hypothetical protein
MGKAARRQQARGSNETERMAAIDHGNPMQAGEGGRDDADDIVVKQ